MLTQAGLDQEEEVNKDATVTSYKCSTCNFRRLSDAVKEPEEASESVGSPLFLTELR